MGTTVFNIMAKAVELGACHQSSKATDWKSLCWLFFSPQGIEFCAEYNYPSIETFRGMKYEIITHGVFVDAGKITSKNRDNVACIGKTEADLTYNENTRIHKVVIMYGAKARIKVENYAVVVIENISGIYEIENDGTGEVLL